MAPVCYVLSLTLPRTKRWCILCSVLSSTSSVSKNPSMGNESSAFNQHTDPESGTRVGSLFLWIVSLLVWECEPSPEFKAIEYMLLLRLSLTHVYPETKMTYWQASVTCSIMSTLSSRTTDGHGRGKNDWLVGSSYRLFSTIFPSFRSLCTMFFCWWEGDGERTKKNMVISCFVNHSYQNNQFVSGSGTHIGSE